VIQWQVREVTRITVRNDRVSLGGRTFGGTRVRNDLTAMERSYVREIR